MKNIPNKVFPHGLMALLTITLIVLISVRLIATSATPVTYATPVGEGGLPQVSLPVLSPGEYAVLVDDEAVFLTSPIILNAADIPYLKVYDIIAALGLEAGHRGSGRLQAQKKGQPDTTVYLDYRWYLHRGQLTAANWKEQYMPLSAWGNEFGYTVWFAQEENWVKVYSPEYQALHPDNPAFSVPVSTLPVYGTEQDAPHFAALWPEKELLTIFFSSILDDLPGRLNNIALACKAMDGAIIQPGESFSYNQTVGQRTRERGYQIGRVYEGQVIMPGIGGGICQVSSALYNAVLNSNLQVIERHPHTIKVEYVDPLRDATVFWGQLDFRFRNNLNFPITLHSQLVDNQYIVIAFSRSS